MLHIIGLILKIVGIILLVVLVLVLSLLAIVLFVPIRYEVSAEFPGNIAGVHARFRLSWFLHLIFGKGEYHDKNGEWNIRVAWKKFSSHQSEEEQRENCSESKKTQPIESESERKQIKQDIESELKQSKPSMESDIRRLEERKPKSHKSYKLKKQTQKKKTLFERLKSRFCRLWKKLKDIFFKICDKIKQISEMKEKVERFINDEIHRNAFIKVRKEMVWIKRFLKPATYSVHLRFGFEDPYTTGQVLAFLSMIYPFLGDDICIEPEFENQILEGNLYIKGKIRLFYLVVFVVKSAFDKNVRKTVLEIIQVISK